MLLDQTRVDKNYPGSQDRKKVGKAHDEMTGRSRE
jgi:hypothetical protein